MTEAQLEISPTDSTTIDYPNSVILFNDTIHSFDEVANQLIFIDMLILISKLILK